MYNGWTKGMTKAEALATEIESVKQLIEWNPGNQYWENRLIALESERDVAETDEWFAAVEAMAKRKKARR